MSHITRQGLRISACLWTVAAIVYACGPDITFRAYLDKKLWRPTVRFIAAMVKDLPPEKANYVPYAGMSARKGNTALQNLRGAYQDLFDDSKRRAADLSVFNGSPENTLNWPPEVIAKLNNLLRAVAPTGSLEKDELELLRCKIQLRAVRTFGDPALGSVQSCFQSYLDGQHSPALASEARGWLARSYFLQNKRAQAAKIYLDELPLASSNIRRERLLTSLSMLYPDTDDHRLEELKADLDEYFDTPEHAMFIADRITNSGVQGPAPNPGVQLYLDLMKQLEVHRNLFHQGPQSDALALQLMRNTTRIGAPTKTLEYAAMIPAAAATRQNPEFDWLLGTANFALGNYPAAEASLKRVVGSEKADDRQKVFAANGLIGVYDRMRRPVEMLHAAFLASTILSDSPSSFSNDDVMGAGLDGWNFDAAYLLDVQLSDAELEEYLTQYPDPAFGKLETEGNHVRPAIDLVQYALAVRHARREEFTEAAQLYRKLGIFHRERRMNEAASLLAATKNPAASTGQRLQSMYDYADFLAKNEDGVFFNDSVWHRFQTWAFLPDESSRGLFGLFNYRALSPGEASQYREQERKLRDDQEEYWRAFQIFDRIVSEAGHTALGRKAATNALSCLRRISTERFGRKKEIAAAEVRLAAWLRN